MPRGAFVDVLGAACDKRLSIRQDWPEERMPLDDAGVDNHNSLDRARINYIYVEFGEFDLNQISHVIDEARTSINRLHEVDGQERVDGFVRKSRPDQADRSTHIPISNLRLVLRKQCPNLIDLFVSSISRAWVPKLDVQQRS